MIHYGNHFFPFKSGDDYLLGLSSRYSQELGIAASQHEVFAALDELRRAEMRMTNSSSSSASPFEHVYANIRGEGEPQSAAAGRLQDQRSYEPGIYAVSHAHNRCWNATFCTMNVMTRLTLLVP